MTPSGDQSAAEVPEGPGNGYAEPVHAGRHGMHGAVIATGIAAAVLYQALATASAGGCAGAGSLHDGGRPGAAASNRSLSRSGLPGRHGSVAEGAA